MSTKKKNESITIIAPHCDDELIGCFRLLKKNKVRRVVYCKELTNERILEAKQCAVTYGFEPVFGLEEILESDGQPSAISRKEIFYVPHASDSHPDHKELNNWAFGLRNPVMYYSVDMSSALNYDVLDLEEREEKKLALLDLYPSQRFLLASNEKYHLFEYCGSSTVLERRAYTVKGLIEKDLGEVEVKLEISGNSVHQEVAPIFNALTKGFKLDDLIKIAARYFPRRSLKATVRQTSTAIEIEHEYIYR